MYGMVNKAIEDLVCSRFGEDSWEAIKENAGVDIDAFVSMDAYSDDVTYRLVGAASEHLNLPVDKVLEAFGEHWVLYTAKEGYGNLMTMMGDSLPTFLQNLNQLHARVRLNMPHLNPPSFRCTDLTATSLRLHYYSMRPGLAPLVVGCLIGLGKMFHTNVHVSQPISRITGADHDEFYVEFT